MATAKGTAKKVAKAVKSVVAKVAKAVKSVVAKVEASLEPVVKGSPKWLAMKADAKERLDNL